MNNCENCVHHIDDVCEHCYEKNVTTCTGFRPVTPKGEWSFNPYDANLYCSLCNAKAPFGYKNFCPECGADMRGDDQ